MDDGGTDRFVLQKAHELGVSAVELWAVDPLGRAQVVAMPIDALDQALEDGFAVSPEALGEAFDRANQDEIHLAPDPQTFSVVSRGEGRASARLICDLRREDGSPSPLCSRSALKRTLGRANQLGALFYAGATLQHHWLRTPEDERALSDQRLIRGLGQEVARALEGLGIAWRSHYLGRDGRFCLELDWVDPLTLADAIVTHRRVVHDLALDGEAFATFEPFPWNAPRTRLDLYLSQTRDGASAFADGLDGLGPAGRTFIRALEAEAGALELVMRSTLHSYAAPEAPLFRRGSAARGGGGPTVLVHGADACANPYALLAATIGLGSETSEASAYAELVRVSPAQTLLEASHRASLSARLRDVLGAELVESLSGSA